MSDKTKDVFEQNCLQYIHIYCRQIQFVK